MNMSTLSQHQARLTVDAASPWFSGHFPDDPILPGVAQLKMVVDLLAASGCGRPHLTALSRVKFRRLVRPGEVLDISVTPGETEGRCSFAITCGDDDVCSGKMLFTPTEHVTTT